MPSPWTARPGGRLRGTLVLLLVVLLLVVLLAWATVCAAAPGKAAKSSKATDAQAAPVVHNAATAVPRPQPEQAAPKPAQPVPVKREVLILYNGGAGSSLRQTLAFDGFQTVFNYFGLVGISADVSERPLPDDQAMTGVCAIMVSFNSGDVFESSVYHEWLHHQLDKGIKLVVLGPLGMGEASNDPAKTARFVELYERLGVRYEFGTFLDRSRLRFTKVNKECANYERAYPEHPVWYERLTPIRPDVEPLVSIERTDREKSESAAVFTSRTGGLIVSQDYAYWQDPATFKQKWYIDPFLFLSKALGLPLFPAPDPTTLNGLRVAFSHVDADGFAGYNQVEKSKVCAEILRDEVLSKFDFPIAYSLIQAEVSPEQFGSERLLDVARSIMVLPNIEPASHTFSHPFFWDANSAQKDRYDDRFAFDIPGYVFDPYKEIVESTEFVTSLSPPDKPCRLLFWSGACEPKAEHQLMATENGLLAINGGDTLWDAANDSLFEVRPLHRYLGEGQHQIHIGQANDNILTNLWRGPYNGYRNITETFRRTGSPRRLKPIDIYYHTFSVEKLAGVTAIKEVYTWVMAQHIAPVRTSWYIQSMMDWFKERVSILSPGRYAVEDYGDCLTVRLPANCPAPALDKCENVLGYDREPEGLYVHLAYGAKRAVVELSGETDLKQATPYLKNASGLVKDFKAAQRSVSFDASFETHDGKLTLAGFTPGAMLRVTGEAAGGRTLVRAAGEDGSLPLDGLSSGGLEVAEP